MLPDAGLNIRYWGYAAKTAVYLRNRSPSKAIKGKSPEEIWSGERVDLSHLRVFRCKVLVHIPKDKRKKWSPKGRECIFVGYSETQKGYACVDPKTPTS